MAGRLSQNKSGKAGKRRGRKARPEKYCYVIDIKDWDWDFMFGVSPIRNREGPYSDYRHLVMRGALLRPARIKAGEVEVSFLPERSLNESERKRNDPQSVGSFQLSRERLEFVIPMPADALPAVLQMMIAGRYKYVVIDGDRPHYGQGRISMYRLVRDYAADDMPPDD